MRKIVVLAAIAALIAAAAGIWSTATFDGPKVAGKVAGEVQATEAPGAPARWPQKPAVAQAADDLKCGSTATGCRGGAQQSR